MGIMGYKGDATTVDDKEPYQSRWGYMDKGMKKIPNFFKLMALSFGSVIFFAYICIHKNKH
jgi:hypothetical protein